MTDSAHLSTGVLAAVLGAAALHALWNSLVKSASDKFLSSAVVALWCGVAAVVAALVLPRPAHAALPFVVASAFIHIVYFLLVGLLYRNADLSVAYPMMRGLAPLIAAAIAFATLGEAPGPVASLGVGALVAEQALVEGPSFGGTADPLGAELARAANAKPIPGGYAPDGSAGRAAALPLSNVELLDSPFLANQGRNTAYLLFLDPDRMLRPFRLNYGVDTQAQPCGGWEQPTSEVRGHTTGHLMSALALTYANTGNDEALTRGRYLVGQLAALQAREDAQGFITLDSRPRFTAGDRVRVSEGVFCDCLGLFEGMSDRERVAILLDLLGRKVRVVLDEGLVVAA